MTDLRKAAEMALEALETVNSFASWGVGMRKIIDNLRQALAQLDNQLDITDRAYFAGKQAGIEETLAQPEQDDERFVNGALPMGGMGFRVVDKAAHPEQKQFNPNPYASKLPEPMGSVAQPEQISVMSGSCAECGVKARDGYALYCVACTDLFTQPEQEPVAWVKEGKVRVGFGRIEERKYVQFDQTLPVETELYTAPPSKPLVSLTDEEINEAFCNTPNLRQLVSAFKAGALWAEAALRSKNETI